MNTEYITRSLVYALSFIVPSGISVVDGDAYGVRYEDPSGKNPAITITLDDTETEAIELGSIGSRVSIIYTVTAQSKLQRNYLKDLVYNYLTQTTIPVYSGIRSNFTLPSGSLSYTSLDVNDPILVRNMPDFSENRERFFWTAVVFTTMTII